ncbi:MAG: type II secretion system protein [Planctomycetota bacterium]|jgi:prepilin-type N-terminal cleavage/methylation domain-containing protein/prepilin-type processing-associated H-X9-DG protein
MKRQKKSSLGGSSLIVRRHSGFTLIELLVVIAIIGLLLSILLPSLSRARSTAKETKCLANMRGMGQSIFTFANDHKDRFQVATDVVGLDAADPARKIYEYDWGYEGKGELLAWPVALGQVAGYEMEHNWDWGVRAETFKQAQQLLETETTAQDFDLVVCPSDQVGISSPFYPRNKSGSNNGLVGERRGGSGESGQGAAYWGRLSYGINEDVAGVEVEESSGFGASGRFVDTNSGPQWCVGETAYPPVSPCGRAGSGKRLRGIMDRAYDPATVGMIFDAGPDNESKAAAETDPRIYANLITSAQTDGPFLSDFQLRFPKRVTNTRHADGRLNVMFADGHGEKVKPLDFREDLVEGIRVPTQYGPKVRVSPYKAYSIED